MFGNKFGMIQFVSIYIDYFKILKKEFVLFSSSRVFFFTADISEKDVSQLSGINSISPRKTV